MNFFKICLFVFATLFLYACSDGDTSSEDTSVTETIDGIQVTFSSSTVEVGEELVIAYTVIDPETNLPVSATIRWGDVTDDRLSINETSISHIYNSAGTFNIAIQPDGGETQVIGSVIVTPAPVDSVSSSAVTPAPAAVPVTFSIDSAQFNYFEVGNGQTQFDSSETFGTVSSSNGSFPVGAVIELNVNFTGGTGVTTGFATLIVQADGSFTTQFNDLQFVASGIVTAVGTFSFQDTATFGNSTFTFTDSDLTQ